MRGNCRKTMMDMMMCMAMDMCMFCRAQMKGSSDFISV